MKKTLIGILILIAAIFVALWYLESKGYLLNKTDNTQTATTTASTNTVTYSCENSKIIQASFGSSTVALLLSDGRSINLPQVVSGSGIRYEEGVNTSQDISFGSEGNNAFLMENNIVTYNNCVAGTTQSNGTDFVFKDQGNTFSFTYAKPFTVSGGGVGYTSQWMQNATSSGLLLAIVTVPQSFEPKTNFSEAHFTVGTSPDPEAVKACLFMKNGNMITKSTVVINGVPYVKFVYGDAGAGNFYDTTSYRTVRNNQCYAIEYTIHSTNIGNYPPNQGITAFDKQKIQTVLENMVQSFKFL